MMQRLSLLFVADDTEVIMPARAAMARDYAVKLLEVDTAKDLALSLRYGVFDAVLCDNRIARFSSMDALELWRNAGVAIPFVLITGRVGPQPACVSIVPDGSACRVRGHVTGLSTVMADVLEHQAAVRTGRGGEVDCAPARFTTVPADSTGPTEQSLSVLAHEIRTPLNIIMGYADLLQESIGRHLDDEGTRSLDAIVRATVRLTNLINDTLDLGRLHLGLMHPLVCRFDATRLVAEVTESYGPAAQAKGLRLSCSLPETVAVETDAHRLRQVLGYLIDNAIKFTPHGQVRVHLACSDDELVVEVHDTGIGIGAADLPHVFDDFRQVDGTSTRSYGGCGLGLALSRRLAAVLCGTITVDSTVGRGSCFRVSLPRVLCQRGVVSPKA